MAFVVDLIIDRVHPWAYGLYALYSLLAHAIDIIIIDTIIIITIAIKAHSNYKKDSRADMRSTISPTFHAPLLFNSAN
ncbi:hypothetical protein [Tengunoibacter tsumagoiensis]|uniref:hypothetical protein n=1 Tax=Tengunoibacter tsumagoiensis TaxID=2014871 RepID=UPI000F825641|nr:hypothetical protein [Tengunoibacter tsumagoiensis]